MPRAQLEDRLPRLLRGRRTALMAQLLGTGVGHAALAVLTVLAMPRLLEARTAGTRWGLIAVLAVAALLIGGLRALERVVAERFGQDYVQEIRLGLVRSALVHDGPSVGVTVARATNDLTAVRNWVAQGLTPLATGIPLIGGAIFALYLLDPVFAAAVGVPTAVLMATLAVLSRVAFARSRELRRRRGRLAAHVADTVHAADAIRAGGGVDREVRNTGRYGGRVVDAAVARARVAGAIRGSALGFASLSLVAVAAVGSSTTVSAAKVATALTVVGLLATPVADLGRVVEFRQSFRAAARILGPALADGRRWRTAERASRGAVTTSPDPAAGVQVTDVALGGQPLPDLAAAPGDRIVVRGADATSVRRFLRLLSGVEPSTAHDGARVRVAGRPLADLPARERRTLVGYAERGQALERGALGRALRYRDPEGGAPVDDVIAAVGLADTVRSLPRGHRTRLRRGGEPLDQADRARVLLGRAVYGEPPLVVLDHLDRQLGARGREELRRVLAAQPGVVVAATEDADLLGRSPTVWDLDDPTAGRRRSA